MMIALSCPGCRNHLEGENNSKIFFCTTCHLGFDMEQGSQGKYPVRYVEPVVHNSLPQVYFPFWEIVSEYKIISRSEGVRPVSRRRFYVTAFFIKNINYFGDIGFYLTSKNLEFTSGERNDIPIFPADRSLKFAIQYPLIYLYHEVSKEGGRPESIEIQIDHTEYAVLFIPFYKSDHEFIDSIISWKYPSGALI
jgi:hypothetical protein